MQVRSPERRPLHWEIALYGGLAAAVLIVVSYTIQPYLDRSYANYAAERAAAALAR